MADLLSIYAKSQPDKPGVIDDRPDGTVTAWTYAELDARANRVANLLLELGAGPGRKVLWCGPNSPEVVAVMSATRKIGAVAVPLNYRLTPQEAHYVIDHSDAEIAYVDAEYVPTFAALGDQPGGRPQKLRHIIAVGGPPSGPPSGPSSGSSNGSSNGPAPDGMLTDADVAAASAGPPDVGDAAGTGGTMIYTSGTTGKPKGAVRAGPPDPEVLGALLNLFGYRPDDIYITSGPLYHSGPSAFMGGALLYGQTIVVQRRFDAEDWLRLVDKYRVSSTFAAPAPIRMICALPGQVKDRYDRSSMRVMVANAAPWSHALKQRYVADFPPESLFEVYGSTELGVDTVLLPEDQMRKPGSCGKPAPGVEIILVGDDGAEVTGTGPDHPGEVFVRSKGAFDTYYKNDASYESNTRGGFHTVGDIGYRDDEGYLYICDRKTDMIISGGVNIYPAEIEAVLDQHPGIYDVAVFGIPSEEWGEIVHATVVRSPGSALTGEEIMAFAREQLAGYKAPRSVDFAEELPRTGSGKLLKRQLRAPYWAGRGAQVG
jgi:fatty-acyl-CoA synthase/long-chain acyl-CoA synthetase